MLGQRRASRPSEVCCAAVWLGLNDLHQPFRQHRHGMIRHQPPHLAIRSAGSWHDDPAAAATNVDASRERAAPVAEPAWLFKDMVLATTSTGYYRMRGPISTIDQCGEDGDAINAVLVSISIDDDQPGLLQLNAEGTAALTPPLFDLVRRLCSVLTPALECRNLPPPT